MAKYSSELDVQNVIRAINEVLGFAVMPGDHDDLVTAAQNFRLPMREVEKARSWFMVKFPDLFNQKEGRPLGDLKILLDENVPYTTALKLRDYGRVSSVFFEGW